MRDAWHAMVWRRSARTFCHSCRHPRGRRLETKGTFTTPNQSETNARTSNPTCECAGLFQPAEARGPSRWAEPKAAGSKWTRLQRYSGSQLRASPLRFGWMVLYGGGTNVRFGCDASRPGASPSWSLLCGHPQRRTTQVALSLQGSGGRGCLPANVCRRGSIWRALQAVCGLLLAMLFAELGADVQRPVPCQQKRVGLTGPSRSVCHMAARLPCSSFRLSLASQRSGTHKSCDSTDRTGGAPRSDCPWSIAPARARLWTATSQRIPVSGRPSKWLFC